MAVFTKETAAAMAAKSHIAAKEARISAEIQRQLAVKNPHLELDEAELFRLNRLSRVRKQLDRLDKLLADECDPQKLDRLMSALNRLQEAEGWLAGRAKPKPSISTKQKPRAAAQSAPEPQDDPPPTS